MMSYAQSFEKIIMKVLRLLALRSTIMEERNTRGKDRNARGKDRNARGKDRNASWKCEGGQK